MTGVVVVVSVMVVVALTRTPGAARGSGGAGRAGDLAQHVPLSVLDSVGAGHGITPPKPLPSGTAPLEQDGKTEILYVGAEYCPYCAAERWPLVVALSRFGTFSNLGGTESAAADAFPLTQTFTFHGATHTSDVLAFVAVETNSNQPDPAGGYTQLDQPTAAQNALLQRYDQEPFTTQAGAIPFLMISNRFVSIGASYDPSILQGMTRDQIAQALSNATSPHRAGCRRGREHTHRRDLPSHGRSSVVGLLGSGHHEDRPGTTDRMTPRWVVRSSLALAVAASAVSTYLTIAHFTTPNVLACSASGAIDCARVTTSAQSRFLGIPVAVLGLVWSIAMVALSSPAAWNSRAPWIRTTRLTLIFTGVLFVLWLVYAELFVIRAICLWCSAMHVLTFALFVLVVLFGWSGETERANGR